MSRFRVLPDKMRAANRNRDRLTACRTQIRTLPTSNVFIVQFLDFGLSYRPFLPALTRLLFLVVIL